MIKKYKYLFLFFLVFFTFVLNVGFVYAFEASYPRIPFLIEIDQNSKLPDFISYFFGLGIYMAGFLAVISFAIGAIRLIMSAESPEAHADAIDRMKGSVLGLILTLSAFIILRTINPVLITPSLTKLGEVAGVFYTNGTETKPCPQAEANISSNISPGFGRIIYKCAAGANIYSPTLLVWKFPAPNFMGSNSSYNDITVERINCGRVADLGGSGSFKIAFETPGVYYCLGVCGENDTCTGYMSGANMASGQLSEPFKNNIKSVMMVNDIDNDIRYGAILHRLDNPDLGGTCSGPLIDQNNINKARACFDVNFHVSSANIFVWNANNSETSGSGIEFYSHPFGWNSGARAGKKILDENTINILWHGSAQSLIFDYTGIDRRLDEIQSHANFQKGPGSIKIKGNYLVALYAGNWYCQVFSKDVPNLNEMEFTNTKDSAGRIVRNIIDGVTVIPIK